MKAALFYGEKDIRVEDRPTPEPGPGEVLIGIKSAGICGSDLHNYRGNRPSTNDVPWEQGHELSGVVEALGTGVEILEVGDRVGIEADASGSKSWNTSCGTSDVASTNRQVMPAW